MDRVSSKAACFYCTFYHWSRLASTRPAFHTSLGSRRSASSRAAIWRPSVTATLVPQSWLTATPTPSTERPADSLSVWEEVVRYRSHYNSSTAITIATRLPAACVSDLESRYGRSLARLSDKSGANIGIDLGRLANDVQQGAALTVGVLYSGTLEACAQVREVLLGARKAPSDIRGPELESEQGSWDTPTKIIRDTSLRPRAQEMARLAGDEATYKMRGAWDPPNSSDNPYTNQSRSEPFGRSKLRNFVSKTSRQKSRAPQELNTAPQTRMTRCLGGLGAEFLRSSSRPLDHRSYSTAAKVTASHGVQDERQRDKHTSEDPAQVADDLKRTLRTLTHPVALITSHAPDHTTTSPLQSARGVTVSSFNTVSLSPTPIVSFNLRVPSRSWDAIRSSEHMAVHILTATPEGAAMAHAFTQPYDDPTEPFRRLERLGVQISLDSSKTLSGRQAPSLAWNGATVAVIEAGLLKEKCVDVGDHVVVFAAVEQVLLSESATSDVAADRTEALSYAMRGYRAVGPSIDAIDLPKLAAAELGLSEAVVDEVENHDSHSRSSHSSRTSSSLSATAQRGFASFAPLQRRHFTTTSPRRTKNVEDCVSDVSLLSTTIDDFLGNPPDGGPLRVPRIAGLIKAQKEAWHASRELKYALAKGTLTPEDSARLEDIVTRNDRHVIRTLAVRAAGDLKRMLDLGRLDFRRAQWMESTIEKGQAVLLEEAKLLRKEADEGKFTAEQFQKQKEKLQQENQLLTTETMRLRQMVDEEAEGGGAERSSFDGFRGNV